MKKIALPRVLSVAILFVFLGAFAFQNADTIARAAASALIPITERAEAPAPAAAAVIEETAPLEMPADGLYSNDRIDFARLEPLAPEMIDQETLWLARCIFSESKRPREQELVAWVVRNRVETGYRGADNYREAVLDPFQFSGFNPGRTREFYGSLTPQSRVPGWQTALRIAYEVRQADTTFRPFPRKTRHFYSEQSMADSLLHPEWASGMNPVLPEREYHIEPRRFRFYAGVN